MIPILPEKHRVKHLKNPQVIFIGRKLISVTNHFEALIFVTGPNSNTTPGKAKTPNGADRFISNRSAINLELAQYKVNLIFINLIRHSFSSSLKSVRLLVSARKLSKSRIARIRLYAKRKATDLNR